MKKKSERCIERVALNFKWDRGQKKWQGDPVLTTVSSHEKDREAREASGPGEPRALTDALLRTLMEKKTLGRRERGP